MPKKQLGEDVESQEGVKGGAKCRSFALIEEQFPGWDFERGQSFSTQIMIKLTFTATKLWADMGLTDDPSDSDEDEGEAKSRKRSPSESSTVAESSKKNRQEV
jgi:hypothetical protein